MNSFLNQIAIRNLNSVIIEKGTGKPKANVVVTLMADLASLGFKLDRKALAAVKTLSQSEIKAFHSLVTKELKVLVGDHVKYTPLFKKFPEDVPDDSEYLGRRIIGFIQNFFGFLEADGEDKKLSCGCIVDADLFDLDLFGACPICQMQANGLDKPIKRIALKDRVKLKVIGLVTESEVKTFIKNLMSAKSSLSPKHQEALEAAFAEYKNDIKGLLPKEIPIKETAALVCSLIMRHTALIGELPTYLTTATDVLRFAVALSGGDISLKEKSKFKLSNPYRRAVIATLDLVANPEEDMMRFRQKWLRLGEYLHIGAYKNLAPNAFKAFDKIRNHERTIQTFNRASHKALLHMLEDQKSKRPVALLKNRPGEFARKLDMILRETNDKSVIGEFTTVTSKIATPLLLKLSKHFLNRSEKADFRYFLPKGNTAKIKFFDGDERRTISESLSSATTEVVANELLNRFKKPEKIKRVYIDPELKEFIVPLTQRSASKALVTVERGTKVSYDPKAKALRLFLYWHEGDDTGRIDVDLSAVAFSPEWEYVTHLSWTALSNLGAVHSGDIQSAPKGASEFIDIDIARFRKHGIRYVAMNVFSFTGQSFNGFECFAGVMEREVPGSGEIYDARTVKNKFDLNGSTTANMPLFVDLHTGQLVWCDIGFGNSRHGLVEGSKGKISNIGKAVEAMSLNLPNLFDLFSLHAEANKARIDTTLEEGVDYDYVFDRKMALNHAEILANWL